MVQPLLSPKLTSSHGPPNHTPMRVWSKRIKMLQWKKKSCSKKLKEGDTQGKSLTGSYRTLGWWKTSHGFCMSYPMSHSRCAYYVPGDLQSVISLFSCPSVRVPNLNQRCRRVFKLLAGPNNQYTCLMKICSVKTPRNDGQTNSRKKEWSSRERDTNNNNKYYWFVRQCPIKTITRFYILRSIYYLFIHILRLELL